jgi:hypothetical protein
MAWCSNHFSHELEDFFATTNWPNLAAGTSFFPGLCFMTSFILFMASAYSLAIMFGHISCILLCLFPDEESSAHTSDGSHKAGGSPEDDESPEQTARPAAGAKGAGHKARSKPKGARRNKKRGKR